MRHPLNSFQHDVPPCAAVLGEDRLSDDADLADGATELVAASPGLRDAKAAFGASAPVRERHEALHELIHHTEDLGLYNDDDV